MNGPITKLFALVVVLFLVLVVGTSWWSVFGAEGLDDNPDNRRDLLRSQQIERGPIVAADDSTIAESTNQGTPTEPLYVRQYPEGSLFAHPVGYAFANFGSAGLEQFYNDDLIGQGDDLESIFGNLNEDDPGDGLRTTLDPEAQRTAVEALGGRPGAIVALEPDTGAVKAMASVPSYDPNQVPDRFDELSDSEPPALPNRATQSGYPPGSTFKVVTAAAALDTGEFNPDSVVDGESPKTVGGTPLENFGGQSFGPISLTEALTNSVNTVFAQVGVDVGAETMFDYMARFGLGERPPLDYPPGQLFASGVYDGGKLLDAGDGVDIGRVAIGQERLLVTPLQMAMIAAAVANEGKLMAPRLGDEIISPEGRVTERVRPSEVRQVMEPESASALTQMMTDVVNEGSGTAAALEGIDVAGKTGTAEVEGGATNQAWFIAFAPAGDPEMAIAVTIERTQGTGGEEAAPLAKRVLEVLIAGG